jgi:hypothetical protein
MKSTKPSKTQHKMERNFTELKAKVCSSPTYFMNSMIWDVGTLNGISRRNQSTVSEHGGVVRDPL